MKNHFLLIVLLMMSSLAFGQSNKEDLELLQSIFGKEKKELVKMYMTIPQDKAEAFWKLYDEYETERKALGTQRAELIEAYGVSYETIDDKKATELMEKKYKLLDSYTKLQKKYFGKISGAIGGKQAAKFFQLEDYLENNIRLMIQENLPFIDELEKSKVTPPSLKN